jgi:Ca-activated chloride channel family protein
MLSYLWDFADPGFIAPGWILAGLAAMALLALLEIRLHRLRERAVRAFAASNLMPTLVGGISVVKRVAKGLLVVAAVGLLFVALARPYLFFDWTEETRGTLDVLVAVDCSKSMLTEDVPPSRLDRSKLAIVDFAARLPENRLGLIAFAGDAFLQCPLTLDHEAFLDSVRELDTETIPRPGTNMAAAIEEAIEALRSQPINTKFMVLVSDGENLEGEVLDAAKDAAKNGLKIYTVGVGTPNGDRIPERDATGMLGYHRDENGQEVVSRLDEKTLRQIAEISGGSYEPLGQDGHGLEDIYDRYIAPLPKQILEEKRRKIHLEQFEWPLAAAILFLMCEFMINERIRSAGPAPAARARPPARRRPSWSGADAGAAMMLALLVGAVSVPLKAAGVAEAERAYLAGDYDRSMQEYQEAAESNPGRPQLQFNRGDAAYKAGEFSEAEEAYGKALETPDLNLQEQAYYNLGNSQFEHGVALLKLDSGKTIKLWKDALHSYECALKLKKAADTEHNYEVVKQKLEQLQKHRQEGGKDSSGSGRGQSGDGQSRPGASSPSGETKPGASDEDQTQPGSEGGNEPPPGQATTGAATSPVQAYSGTRSEDLKDPQIRSREDAERLLDSLKDDERHVTARTLAPNGQDAPPTSGKDW